MTATRVLIVDDSVVMRRDLAALLSRDRNLEVVGSASGGHVALMKIPLLRPDVIALDVDMPDMNGVDALAAIRVAHPRIPVIMLSTAGDASLTVDALTRGARGYVMKPDNPVPAPEAMKVVAADLIAK